MKLHEYMIFCTLFAASSAGFGAESDLSARFYQAIRNDDLSSLNALLKNGDVNVKDQRGATPLMYAVAFGNAEQIKMLLDAGAKVDVKNAFNATALIWAAGDPVKSKMLVEHGADVNVKSQQGRTPLMVAAGSDGDVEGRFRGREALHGAHHLFPAALELALELSDQSIRVLRFHALECLARGACYQQIGEADGSHGIGEGVIYSYPVTVQNGEYRIVPGLTIDDFSRQRLDASLAELREERDGVKSLLG